MTPTWPYGTAVFLQGTALLGLSYVLGERHKVCTRNEPYQSGIATIDSAWLCLSAKFCLVAIQQKQETK